MAIMLYFMQQKIDAEFLFTNDEEIGMIGAKNLSLPIHSRLLINLDSERLGEITIGCAGGFDFTFSGRFHAQNLPHGCHYYTLKAKNFVGGHSGIDINNKSPNFQNAIIKSLTFLAKITEYSNYEIKIIHIQGGEKRNSIPANCKIIFASENSLDTLINAAHSEFFEISKNESVSGRDIKPLNETFMHKKPCAVGFGTLFDFISSIKIGVLESSEGVVQSSLNLSQICFDDGVLNLAFMGRANTRTLLDSNLEALKHALCNCKLLLDVKTQVGEYYAPWEKDAAFSYEKFYGEVGDFADKNGQNSHIERSEISSKSNSQNTKDSANFNDKNSQNLALKLLYKNMQKYVRDVGLSPKIVELHAGLECGILLSQFAKMNCQNITALSIGPSIHSPHSTKERVWIESCGITTQILLDFLREYK
ncbi:peptidase dimerization domain-containing protein [Helicobacter saguini]